MSKTKEEKITIPALDIKTFELRMQGYLLIMRPCGGVSMSRYTKENAYE